MTLKESSSNVVHLRFGELLLALRIDSPSEQLLVKQQYSDFISDSGEPVALLNLRPKQQADLTGFEKIFDSGAVWQVWQSKDHYAFCFRLSDRNVDGESQSTEHSYQTLILDKQFKTGDIYMHPAIPGQTLHPFDSIACEVLTTHLLSLGTGVLLHASALEFHGEALLFSGNSGAGKSTMAGLWLQNSHAALIGDDRVILGWENGQYLVYKTPWNRFPNDFPNRGIPIKQIFILKQAPKNHAQLLKPAQASALLLARAFPPFWYSPGVKFTLDFLAELCQSVKCYELEFTADTDVVEYIQCLIA